MVDVAAFFCRGQWNAYCEGARDADEREQRLAEVPDAWRQDVRKHCDTVDAIREQQDKRAQSAFT